MAQSSFPLLDSPSMQSCIEYANLTQKYLALKRRIKQAKAERKNARKHFALVQKHYQDRQEDALMYTSILFSGVGMAQEFLKAAKSQYEVMPAADTLRIHAQLIKYTRNQILMERHLHAKIKDYDSFLYQMEKRKENLIENLELEEERIDTIQDELADLVIEQVESLYKENGKFCHKCIAWENDINNQRLASKIDNSLENANQNSPTCMLLVSYKDEYFPQCNRS
mmetsp:Transcript_447/g.647  ORF Transcript_447/g.647 Transcript_447/m.647 type:complete len:225 (-) Transcript_447:89-763(-)